MKGPAFFIYFRRDIVDGAGDGSNRYFTKVLQYPPGGEPGQDIERQRLVDFGPAGCFFPCKEKKITLITFL